MEKFKVNFWIQETCGKYHDESFGVVMIPRKGDLVEVKFYESPQEYFYKVKSVTINLHTNYISVELKNTEQ